MISGSSLVLQSASATIAGLVNTLDQNFAGEKTFLNTYNFNTAPTNPGLGEGGADSPYPDGTVIAYHVYSYIFFNGNVTLSTTFLDAGFITISSGGGGGVGVSWDADTNPNVSGYFVVKNVNGAGFLTGGDAGNNTGIFDDSSSLGSSIPGNSYSSDGIIPHYDVTSGNIYSLYSPDMPIAVKTVILTNPLPVASGGTGESDGTIHDAGNSASIDFYNHKLYTGPFQLTVDYGNGLLVDASNSTALDWFSRQLLAAGNNLSIDYQNRFFGNSAGQNIFQYSSHIGIFSPDTTDPALTIDAVTGQAHTLVDFRNSAGGVQLSLAANARDWVLDTTTGTKIGTATSQKLGFYNATPIVQPTGNILTALSNLGLVGTPSLPAGTGTVTSVGLTVPASSIFAATGSPVTTSGNLGFTVTGVSGGIPYFDSTSTLHTSSILVANQLLVGGGAGSQPTGIGSLGTTTTVLHGNAAGGPTFGAVSLTADVSGTLPIANAGTNITSYTTGDILYASATNVLSKLAAGTSGQYLKQGASIPSWAPLVPANPAYVSKTGSYTLASGTDNIVSWDTSGGVGTATLPTAVGVTGQTFTIQIGIAGNILTINTTSSQTIGGIASGVIKMGTIRDTITVYSDGANWKIQDIQINVGIVYTGAPPTGTLSAGFNNITYPTKVSDPLSAYSSGIYTTSLPGTYLVSFVYVVSATFALNTQVGGGIGQNAGQAYKSVERAGGVISDFSVQINTIIRCAVSDAVSAQSFCGGTGPSFGTDPVANVFSIQWLNF